MDELDHSVGEVLRTLKETGVDGETLVLFTSDNGPAKMEHPGREGTGGSAGLFREYKGSTWEGGGSGAVHRKVAGQNVAAVKKGEQQI